MSNETQPAALRVDAARNRLALVCAAATVFGRRGTEAPLEEVAREAGVGIATLYRRFETRDALIEAVYLEKMSAYVEQAKLAAERSRTDPWGALSAYVTYIMSEQAQDPAFAEVLIAPQKGSELFADLQLRAFASTVALAERARNAGVVRPDFDHSDIFMVTAANKGLVETLGNARKEVSARLCTVVLDGFRTRPADAATSTLRMKPTTVSGDSC